jgi:hypothetical protein
MTTKTTVLPDRNNLARRLAQVDNDPHTIEKFHPHILKDAGQEKTGLGVAMALALATSDYTAGLPPILAAVVQLRLPEYVRAIVDDPQVQADALASLQL